MPRCAYIYDDGARCVWEGTTEMCPDHRAILRHQRNVAARKEANAAEYAANGMPERMRRPKKGSRVIQPSRVQSAREIVDKLPPAPPGPPGDPSAPYCTCRGATADKQPCRWCGKPHFMNWREGVAKRGQAVRR